jgi:hypothetical protein
MSGNGDTYTFAVVDGRAGLAGRPNTLAAQSRVGIGTGEEISGGNLLGVVLLDVELRGAKIGSLQ